jgi:hypothetical protein
MDKPWKTPWFPLPCPQVGGCPNASPHRNNIKGSNSIPGQMKPSTGDGPLLPRPASQFHKY